MYIYYYFHFNMYVDIRLCSLISLPKEAIPRSKSEAVLSKLAVAAAKSASSGRPFLTLCSLIDPKGTGYITHDELVTTAKMMDCSIAKVELDALLEVVSTNPATRLTGHIDYKQLNTMLQHHNNTNHMQGMNTTAHDPYGITYTHPQAPTAFGVNVRDPTLTTTSGGYLQLGNTGFGQTLGTASFNGTAALGGTYGPRATMLGSPSYQQRTQQGSMTYTAAGPAVMTHTLMNGGTTASGLNSYERIISAIADRVAYCLREKSAAWGTPYSLRKNFETFDSALSGGVSTHRFQSVLDDIGVILSPSDLQAIAAMYSKPDEYEKVDYDSFCRDAVDNYGFNGLGSTTINSAAPQYYTSPTMSHGTLPNINPVGVNTNALVSIQNLRTLSRLQELKSTGVDLYRSFASYDPNNTGLVSLLYS